MAWCRIILEKQKNMKRRIFDCIDKRSEEIIESVNRI